MKSLLLIGAAFLATLPMTAFARGRVGIFAGPGFAPYGWYSPYYGMYPYGPSNMVPNAGRIKLDTKVKDAGVFVNGSYAGTVGQLKTMAVRSGTYNIEVREPGRAPFAQRIYVVAGKTLTLHPDVPVQSQ